LKQGKTQKRPRSVFAVLATNHSRYPHTPSSRPSRWHGAQTADSDRDWLKQLKHFTADLSFCFQLKQNSFETVLFVVFQFCFSFISINVQNRSLYASQRRHYTSKTANIRKG